VLVDTQGHARRTYDVYATQARKALPSIVIIRPDTYTGAFVHEVEKYFSKIFVSPLRGCVITYIPPSIQLRKSFASFLCRRLLASIQGFPGRLPTQKIAGVLELVVDANPIGNFWRPGSICRISASRMRMEGMGASQRTLITRGRLNACQFAH
jgi:hypothetical protein